jgi:hypothetical protein
MPIIDDNSIGSFVSVPGHVLGIFKCDTNSYKYVDNDFVTEFNIKAFKISVNKNIEYKIKHHPYHGIYIWTSKGNTYFTSKNNYYKGYDIPVSDVIDIYNVYEYTGSIDNFKQSNEMIKKFYSPNYRLFFDIENNNIEGVQKIYNDFPDEIKDDYSDDGYTVFAVAMLERRFNIVKIIIKHMKNYDAAIEFICRNDDGSYEYEDILKLLIKTANTKKINITINEEIIRLLNKQMKHHPFINILKTHNKSVESKTKDVRKGKFYKKYIMYKQKYLNLKNKLSNL